MTRINSIERNFGGGDDPSNKAMRRSLMKQKHSRPTSANPHHMRSVNKASLMHNATFQEQLRFDGQSKYNGGGEGHGATIDG